MNLKARLTPELDFIGPDTPLVEAVKAMRMIFRLMEVGPQRPNGE